MNSLDVVEGRGFGDYEIPGNKTFEQYHKAELIKQVALVIITTLAIAVSIYAAVLMPPLGIVTAGLGLLNIFLISKLIGTCSRTPPINYLFDPAQTAPIAPLVTLDSKSEYSAILPKDSVESFEWKCKLIQHAEQSIVFSGCYAGGRSFDRILELCEQRMEEKPNLKVSIISSKVYHTAKNREKIAELSRKYPDRFLNIAHEEYILYKCPERRDLITGNHTKMLVIDGGAYFVIGGSGAVSMFTDASGLEEPNPEEDPYGPILNRICPAAFRDQDFVFHSPDKNGLGARLHIEASKLVEIYKYRQDKKCSPRQELPDPTLTKIPEFDADPTKVNQLSLACLPSGPEHTKGSLEEAMVKEIDRAERTLVFAHLYSFPTKKIQDAIIRASNRGIQITLITNKAGRDNPILHHSFAERSRHGYKQWFEGRPKENILILEYDVPNVSYHKKILIVDGESVLTGSSNLGPKSLERQDYEIDWLIRSPEFASKTMEILEVDLKYCSPVDNEQAASPSLSNQILNAGLEIFTPLV
ncbi:MAG: phosphatidylserine/phosphatidylglycerophosphate/cardiolipin synthase family protein [Verrucomicrobia bacterium]|nr:phosphatidylserine/phosphatidylglycerophosphate/cardiolipin synthase family protein [Verrucomicrobiota bacterium]